MKNSFKFATLLLLGAIMLLSSCKEEPPITPNEQPPQKPASNALKININQLPGTTTGLNNLSVIISLTKDNGETVLTDESYELSFHGKYSTPVIPVAKGNYKLTKLIVKKADGSIVFATPIAGSTKANQVNKPLAINTTVADTTALDLEVLAVSPIDQSQDFGYINGTFNEKPTENPVTEFTFTVQPIFQVGNVVYDSIPVSLKITKYPLQGGEPFTTIHVLPGGPTKITLSKQAAKYKLSLSKWGMADTAIILPNDMKDGNTYLFGGNKAAKKLKYESVYKQSGTSWIADTRKEYFYANNNRLYLIMHYRKDANRATVLDMKEEIEYQNNRVSEIQKSTNNQISYYTYKADGKLDQIRYTDKDGQTTGHLNYVAFPGKIGISNNYGIGAEFESTKFHYKQYYSYDIYGGNVIKTTYATTHGDSNYTLYSYDFGINPYIHLGLPELSFTNLSKHNVTKQYAYYTIGTPPHIPYNYSYVYDADGYPIELYTKYRLPGTATEAFSTKTVFNYY